MIANWDDVQGERLERGHMCGTWTDLGDAAGSQHIGVNRVQIEPGKWSTPVHRELDAEEIFFVLGGSGVSWQNGKAYEIRDGDCIVYRVAEEHTLRAGDEGLDVLAFGERIIARYTHFPRTNVIGNYPGVTVDVSQGPRAWDREVEAGEPDLPEPSPRPANIVNAHDVAGKFDGSWKRLAAEAGSVRTGLNLAIGGPGEDDADPHCHSADEEIFVVLAGSGRLELWPAPLHAAQGAVREDHPIRAGDVISRPAGTGIGHNLAAGDEGLTYLAYGTRRPDDVCYYPRTNQVYFRGLGLLTELPIVAPEE